MGEWLNLPAIRIPSGERSKIRYVLTGTARVSCDFRKFELSRVTQAVFVGRIEPDPRGVWWRTVHSGHPTCQNVSALEEVSRSPGRHTNGPSPIICALFCPASELMGVTQAVLG
jgi:hypothetical protein